MARAKVIGRGSGQMQIAPTQSREQRHEKLRRPSRMQGLLAYPVDQCESAALARESGHRAL